VFSNALAYDAPTAINLVEIQNLAQRQTNIGKRIFPILKATTLKYANANNC
jgi:hypothetical protein